MQWVTLNHRPPDPEFEVLTAQPHISRWLKWTFKSIGLQEILNGNAANKLGGSGCADLTSPPRSVPSLLMAYHKTKPKPRLSPEGGREGKILQE